MKYWDIKPAEETNGILPNPNISFKPSPIMSNREMHNLFSPDGTYIVPVTVLKKIPVGSLGYEKVVLKNGEAYLCKEVYK